MKIRIMRKADVVSAGRLANRIFKDSGYSPSKAFRAAQDWPSDAANEILGFDTASIEYYVADLDGEIVGTSGIYSISPRTDVAELGWFCVNPKYRGQGIGQKLFEFSENRAKKQGFKALKLWTEDTDVDAHRLYRRNGMKRAGKDSKGYLIFRKPL